MSRCLLLLVFVSACAPGDPSGPDSTGGSEAGTTTGGPPTTGGSSTTGVVTTGDASTSGSAPVCPWDELEGAYCPLLVAPNMDLVAETPYGAVTFKYAYFGLFTCASCPEPYAPALGLFAQEQSPGLDPFVGDYLLLHLWNQGDLANWPEGRIAGESIDLHHTSVTFPTLMRATTEQTTPPLDPEAAPTMAGTILVSEEGWTLAGEFTASLCTELNWTPPCE